MPFKESKMQKHIYRSYLLCKKEEEIRKYTFLLFCAQRIRGRRTQRLMRLVISQIEWEFGEQNVGIGALL